MENYDLIIIGGGPSGLISAIEAKKNGVEKVIILDREKELGGALSNCIHSGFSFDNCKENLTASEYIQLLADKVMEMGVIVKLNSTVLNLSRDKTLIAVNNYDGVFEIHGKVIILATGCREKPIGYKNILGHRSAGIITSISVLKYINKRGIMPGREYLILGSGDTAILTARTLILEGAKVKSIIESSSEIHALREESKKYLSDFNIPILYNHRVIEVYGEARVEGVKVVEVDIYRNTVQGTERYITCDTLVLSINLYPENLLGVKIGMEVDEEKSELVVDENMETSIKGFFACGTVLKGYDVIENVAMQGKIAGQAAARFIENINNTIKENNKNHGD
ncbi:NAD(P)/FAD-dependent oxidoreductase [Clostridium sp.]|uniref:NAD(P)/FAD-dependent oxidoreductase n=1 Tax=Clostridium sp. TaxID=1506 RepID=UPI002FC8EE81